MEETNKNQESRNSDDSIGNTLEDLQRELADYREALCRLVIISEAASLTSDFNPFLEDDQISFKRSEIVEKPSEDCQQEKSDTSTQSNLVCDNFSMNNDVDVPDHCIRDFQARNGNNTNKKGIVPNVNRVAGKPCRISDPNICSSSASETLNTSHRGSEAETYTSNSKILDYGSEVPASNNDKDESSGCISQTSATAVTSLESDSDIASSYLRISENYLGASSTKILSKEYLRSLLSNINLRFSNDSLINCDTSTNSANDSQCSTEVPTSFMTTDEGTGGLEFESKSSEHPKAVIKYNFSDSNPIELEILKTSDKKPGSDKCSINVSKSKSEIRHSDLKFTDSNQESKPEALLITKLRNLVNAFAEFQDASSKVFQDNVIEFSNMEPLLCNVPVTPVNSDADMKNEVSKNNGDKYDSLNTSIRSIYPDSNSVPSKNITFSDDLEDLNFKFSDEDAESYCSDLMFTDSDNEPKPDKRSSDASYLPEGLQNLNNPTAELERNDKVLTAQPFSDTELASNNDLVPSVNFKETNENEVTANSMNDEDDCVRLKTSVSSNDSNTTAEIQGVGKEVDNAEIYSKKELTSDNDLRTCGSLLGTEEHETSVDSLNTEDEGDRLEALICSEQPITTDYFKSIFQDIINAKNNDPGSSDSLPETDGSEASDNSINTDDECDRLDALACSKDAIAIDEIQSMGQEDINSEAFSNIGNTSDNNVGACVNLQEAKGNEISATSKKSDAVCDRLDALIFSEDPNTALRNQLSSWKSISTKDLSFLDNVSEYGHYDLKLPKRDQESRPGIRPHDIIEALNNLRNQIDITAKSQGVINGQDTAVKDTLGNEQSQSIGTNETIKNEISFSITDAVNLIVKAEALVGSSTQKKAERSSENNSILGTALMFSDSDSKTNQSGLKISNADGQSLTFIESHFDMDVEKRNEKNRRKNAEYFGSPDVDNYRVTSMGSSKRKEKDADTLLDIFKREVKFHPLKKFEIPPYESTNAERTLEKLDDPFTKNICDVVQPNSIEHRNSLSVISDTDSHSVMVFDVTDCFSQNSSIICEGLIKEYLNISFKVNSMLTKGTKDLSEEEYELRMRDLLSLDDQVAYINAKLITTVTDWRKQFLEIYQNIEQSRIGSCGVYHLEILKHCITLVALLLKFSFEKQMNLENYENGLIYQYKRSD